MFFSSNKLNIHPYAQLFLRFGEWNIPNSPQCIFLPVVWLAKWSAVQMWVLVHPPSYVLLFWWAGRMCLILLLKFKLPFFSTCTVSVFLQKAIGWMIGMCFGLCSCNASLFLLQHCCLPCFARDFSSKRSSLLYMTWSLFWERLWDFCGAFLCQVSCGNVWVMWLSWPHFIPWI